MIEVCCALIFQNRRLLAVQRGVNSDHHGQWEFPGGKIEAGESAVACIEREIQEELGVRVKVRAFLFPVEHDYGIKQIKLYPFVCAVELGEIKLAEHENLLWLKAENMIQLNWQEADRELIRLNEPDILMCLGENNYDR